MLFTYAKQQSARRVRSTTDINASQVESVSFKHTLLNTLFKYCIKHNFQSADWGYLHMVISNNNSSFFALNWCKRNGIQRFCELSTSLTFDWFRWIHSFVKIVKKGAKCYERYARRVLKILISPPKCIVFLEFDKYFAFLWKYKIKRFIRFQFSISKVRFAHIRVWIFVFFFSLKRRPGIKSHGWWKEKALWKAHRIYHRNPLFERMFKYSCQITPIKLKTVVQCVTCCLSG